MRRCPREKNRRLDVNQVETMRSTSTWKEQELEEESIIERVVSATPFTHDYAGKTAESEHHETEGLHAA